MTGTDQTNISRSDSDDDPLDRLQLAGRANGRSQPTNSAQRPENVQPVTRAVAGLEGGQRLSRHGGRLLGRPAEDVDQYEAVRQYSLAQRSSL
jgi:hypothetical protein